MNRPDDCKRIHFSCAGGIALINLAPIDMLRAGDTASGRDSDGRLWLWSCTEVIGGRGFWTTVEEWTERGATACVGAADMLVVIEGSGATTFAPSPRGWVPS